MAKGKENPPPPPSYAAAVGKVSPTMKTSTSFASIQNTTPISQFKGEPAMFLSEEEEDELAKDFQWTLIGKFSWGRPSMAQIRKEVLAAGFLGECKAGLYDNRHVMFKFDKEEDFQRFWTRKVWHFQGFQVRIFKWAKDFDPAVEPTISPVWIRFPHLPLHLFRKEKLFSLASIAGKPLKLDNATAAASDMLRPSEARVCVELDLTKIIPNRVWIGSKEKGRWQSLEVEDRPAYCAKCHKLGHESSNCDPGRRQKSNPPNNPQIQKKVSQGEKHGTKEWMLVTNRHDAKEDPARTATIPTKGKEADPSSLVIIDQPQEVPETSGAVIEPALQTESSDAAIVKEIDINEIDQLQNNKGEGAEPMDGEGPPTTLNQEVRENDKEM